MDTLDCTLNLFEDIKDFSTRMINTGHTLIKQLETFRKEKIDTFKEKKREYEKQTVKYCTTLEKYLQSSQNSKRDRNHDQQDVSTDFKEVVASLWRFQFKKSFSHFYVF